MDKRGILAICAFVILLACFFQFSRMDGFLYLDAVQHKLSLSGLTEGEEMPARDGLEKGEGRDIYLVFYDQHDVASTFMRHRLEWLLNQQKKGMVSVSVYDADVEVKQGYRGVILATGILGRVAALPKVLDYVRAGGQAAVLMRPEAQEGEPLSPEAMTALGITSLGGDKNVPGLELPTHFFLGGYGFRSEDGKAYQTDATLVELADKAAVHMRSADGFPLMWEQPYEKGRFFVYNGGLRDDKSNVGTFTAIISHMGEETIYPVLNTKIFYIDDFPAPVPEGNFDKIYDELGVSTVEFFRNIWWPFMRDCAKKYELKYTGLIIESYGDQVKGPFHPTMGRAARDNLVIYGREILDMGGELGLHGYNHQSLAVAGYNQDKLGYMSWDSKADMVEAMRELRRYIHEVYPGYTFMTYVPPSDILSPEGHEAVKEAFPELKTYSSLFDGLYEEKAYYQDFERNEDGTHEIPRVTSGYAPVRQEMWADISVANYIGVFSHFVHPDELFYEESKDLTWGMMREGFESFLEEINQRFPWLRPTTAAEATAYFDDYLDMDYRLRREPDRLVLTTKGNRYPLHFVLRTKKEIDRVEGAVIRPMDEGAYLVETQGLEVSIYWKEGS